MATFIERRSILTCILIDDDIRIYGFIRLDDVVVKHVRLH